MREKHEDLELVPYQTWVSHIMTVLWFVVGGTGVYHAISGILTGNPGFWWSLTFFAFGLICIYMATTRFAINYRFTGDALEIRAWGNSRSITWADIVEVDTPPTFYAPPPVRITTIRGKTEMINTDYFANTRMLNQTLLETIHSHNPNVKIGSFALGMYGQPPYGIPD